MSGKDKVVDHPDCSDNDIGLISFEKSPCKKPAAEGRTDGKAGDNVTSEASAGRHIEQTRSDLPCKSASDIPLEELNINQTTISGKDSEASVGDQPNAAQRIISKCFEAALYFFGESGSLGNSDENKSSVQPDDLNVVEVEIPGENGNDGFVEISHRVVIQERDLVDLMTNMRLYHYTVSENPEAMVFGNCKDLFEKDYDLEFVDNRGGSLTNHYPESILIPCKSKGASEKEIDFDKEVYTELVKCATGSRCRGRFVVPAILFDKKFICRSGTLSVRKGAFFETATKAEPPQDIHVETFLQGYVRKVWTMSSSIVHWARSAGEATMTLLTSDSMEKLRDIDRQILKTLKLKFICDLMVEDRKMFKQTIAVSSSEKINRGIYGEFKIEQMPYPGCEFFERYHSAGREAEGLVFDWPIPECNTELEFSSNPTEEYGLSDINWDKYKDWDINELTKNYLKVLLHRLVRGQGGLLVHCISGWDRTPLIISLLRVSLWADKVIHQSLDMREIAYLTLAYDWYLFGHTLPARIKAHEEIMHYCFHFLPSIANDEFSVTRIFEKLPCREARNRTFPPFERGCREVLNKLSTCIMEIYNDVITSHSD